MARAWGLPPPCRRAPLVAQLAQNGNQYDRRQRIRRPKSAIRSRTQKSRRTLNVRASESCREKWMRSRRTRQATWMAFRVLGMLRAWIWMMFVYPSHHPPLDCLSPRKRASAGQQSRLWSRCRRTWGARQRGSTRRSSRALSGQVHIPRVYPPKKKMGSTYRRFTGFSSQYRGFRGFFT